MSGPALVVVAAVAEAVFFTLFGEPFAGTRASAYTLGFFLFWLFGAVSSGFTCFLSADLPARADVAPARLPETGRRRNRAVIPFGCAQPATEARF